MAATVTSAPKSGAPTVLKVRADDFRAHPIPGVDGAKVGSCYVNAADLIVHLPLDGWLNVNPRVPSRNAKGVLSGHVVKGIQETLRGYPQDFALKCLGLFLLVEEMEHERMPGGTGELRLTLSDVDSHGLCNGGHAYAAIRDFAESEGVDALKDAYVRIHIYQGIPSEKVIEIAEGMNRSKQVDDPSLADLAGNFSAIKKAMDGRTGAKEIAYHQGEEGTYYVTDIIRVIMFFNRERFDDTNHPHRLYRQQKVMLRQFKEDFNSRPSPLDILIPKLDEFLRLADNICKATPDAAGRLSPPFEFGRMKPDPKKSGRAGSKEHRGTRLCFIGETMDHKVANGWLMPMLAAFRANLRWNLSEGVCEWREPIDELLNEVIGDLVRICVQEHKERVKPDEIGRKPSVYEQCYDKVERYLDKLEIERLRSEDGR